jgi:5-methylcytosine-specific restriction endonuclease McrBC regulatory subunit McrC
LAGSLSLPEISLEIVPKFILDPANLNAWNASTLFLLEALAGRHVVSIAAERQQWKSHHILDLIANAFADAAERGLREQRIQVYRQSEESSVVLRGRLNLPRQLRNLVRAPHLLECDVDQLDAENAFNDVLKWAATILARSAREQTLRARLDSIANTVPGDANRSAAFRHLRLLPPPQFRAWTDALQLARLLACGQTFSNVGGRTSGYSLLFNMERAFERFVEYGLARTLRKRGGIALTAHRQEWARYALPDGGGIRPLGCRPDNVVKRNGVPVLIVDAKYKLLEDEFSGNDDNRAAPTSTDIYELLAGMLAHRCTLGLLVYPGATDPQRFDSPTRTWVIDSFGTKLRVGAVPVNLLSLRSRADVDRALAHLGQQIANFESGAAPTEVSRLQVA